MDMDTERDRLKAINSEPYLSSKSKAFIDSISPIDDYGFNVKQSSYWMHESIENELKRLEMNQAFFKESVNGGYKFPPGINKDRMDEYHRIKELKLRVG